jgi:hypothetical protein
VADIYHIGFPKCGSTFLQKNVFPHLRTFETAPLEDMARAMSENPFDAGWTAQFGMNPNGADRVFSSEAFLTTPYSAIVSPATFAKRNRGLVNLARSLPDSARVLIQIRRQDRMVQSIFQYAAPSFLTSPEDLFIDYPVQDLGGGAVRLASRTGLIYFDALDFSQVVDIFGADRVDVLALEELEVDPGSYFERVSAIFSEDLRHLAAAAAEKTNASSDVRTRYPAILSALKPVVRALGVDGLARRAMRRRTAMSESFSRRVLRDYADGNRCIQQTFRLPLSDFGYFPDRTE